MKWGIVVKWDDRGLACCEWMQLTDELTIDDPREFTSEADIITEIDRRIASAETTLASVRDRSTGSVAQRDLRGNKAAGAVRELRSLRDFITADTKLPALPDGWTMEKGRYGWNVKDHGTPACGGDTPEEAAREAWEMWKDEQ